jgi:hypothetical protein
MTATSKNGIRRQLHTLDDLIAYGNELDDDRRASLFEFGDLIGEYEAAHLNCAGESPGAIRS